MVVRETEIGKICVICYHHVLSFSMVRVKNDDLPVCQSCGNALAGRACLNARIVKALSDCMLRRLLLDQALARSRQVFEDFDVDEDTVRH